MTRTQFLIVGLIVIALSGVAIFFGVSYLKTEEKRTILSGELDRTLQELSSVTEKNARLENTLRNAERDNEDLAEALEGERERNERFEDQIKDLAGTVGALDKLSKTDKELLQKYSRVYFLNEHYRPEDLDRIDDEYLYSEDEPEFLHAEVMPYLENMLEDALDDDINLWIVSGFRSFDEQEDLKGDYLVHYGSGSNTFSADQGYSEHQLGTTLDFTTDGLNGNLDGFEETEAYEWLTENAHKYGFVLSYPEDNGYYVFEPWHWRFVGENLAEDLHDDGDHFYDWEQRDIDEYLISIFD